MRAVTPDQPVRSKCLLEKFATSHEASPAGRVIEPMSETLRLAKRP
jgi:hypothetical protein